jgi:hypothetical protein
MAVNGPKNCRKKKKIFFQLPTKYRKLHWIQISLIHSSFITNGAYSKCKDPSRKVCDFRLISVLIAYDINILMRYFLQSKSC